MSQRKTCKTNSRERDKKLSRLARVKSLTLSFPLSPFPMAGRNVVKGEMLTFIRYASPSFNWFEFSSNARIFSRILLAHRFFFSLNFFKRSRYRHKGFPCLYVPNSLPVNTKPHPAELMGS